MQVRRGGTTLLIPVASVLVAQMPIQPLEGGVGACIRDTTHTHRWGDLPSSPANSSKKDSLALDT